MTSVTIGKRDHRRLRASVRRQLYLFLTNAMCQCDLEQDINESTGCR